MGPLAFLLAGVMGFVLGLLGGGGSVLAVPMFVYGLHVEPKEAIAMSLPVVGLTSLLGAVGYWREGLVDGRRALVFGTVAMSGAFAGARLSVFLSGTTQLLMLTAVMVAAGASMMGRAGAPEPGVHAARATLGGRAFLLVAVVALGIGVLTGLVGIGGGFLFVPALVLLIGMPMKQAVGTSLAVIAMNAAAGFAGHAGLVSVRWDLVLLFAAVAAAGVIAGQRAVRFVPQRTLQRAFGVFLLAVAASMLVQESGPVTASGARPASAQHEGAPYSHEESGKE